MRNKLGILPKHILTDAALLGSGTASAAVFLDWLARHGIGTHALSEWVLFRFVGSPFSVMHRVVFLALSVRVAFLVVPAALLLVWPRARPVAAQIIVAVAAVLAFWIAGTACAALNAIEPSLGLVPAAASMLVAAFLASRSRSLVAPMLVVATGITFGTLIAEFTHALPLDSSSSWRQGLTFGAVLVPLLASLLLSWVAWRRTTGQAMGFVGRFARLWALSVVCLSCACILAVEEWRTRDRPPEPTGSRILKDRAYDLTITGQPPQLVWTDRARIQVLKNPYAESPERAELDERNVWLPERIWHASRGGIWVANAGKFGWWEVPADGGWISFSPSAWLQFPEWVAGTGANLWTFAEDPVKRRVISVGEYFSRYAVLDRDTGAEMARGTISNATWPFWHFTVDAPSRIVYVSSALDDGGLYELDLDSLRIAKKASDLFLYETRLDPVHQLLWGTRPLTGEVVGVDTLTFDIRYRIPTAFAVRDLQRDETSGDLYTCSFMFGDVFRIDAKSLTAVKIGWCGLSCRNLFLDSQNHSLWVATREGICRIPVPAGSGGSEPGARRASADVAARSSPSAN
jgi:hypothetical protein